MFKIILIMASGIAIGWMLRRRKLTHLGKVTNFLIWVLLFLLGVEVGGDERIIRGIASLGLEAVAVAAGGVAGSALLALLLWRRARGGREAARK